MSGLATCLCLITLIAGPDVIDRDEQVVLFPTPARWLDEDQKWETTMHGWIFEPSGRAEKVAALRLWLAAVLDEDIDLGPHFAERTARFLVDNERGERVRVRDGRDVFDMDDSQPNGHFRGVARLSHPPIDRVTSVAIEAVTRPGDARRFEGQVLLVPPRGVSIISDIDDTLRISNVLDRRDALLRALGRPYEAVPGMPERLARWTADPTVAVHYVSGSPWQLYESLRDFFAEVGYPLGTMHLRDFRLFDQSPRELTAAPVEHKQAALTALLDMYPERRFVMLGDDSEQDPEIYGRFARERPEQVRLILIRRVPQSVAANGRDNDDDDDDDDDPPSGPRMPRDEPAERMRRAFAGLPAGSWRIFSSPDELSDVDLSRLP